MKPSLFDATTARRGRQGTRLKGLGLSDGCAGSGQKEDNERRLLASLGAGVDADDILEPISEQAHLRNFMGADSISHIQPCTPI